MAQVEWNKVTPFSKCIALVLFISLPLIAFWFGVEYGMLVSEVYSTPVISALPTSSLGDGGYYANTAAWQTDTDTAAGFSIEYPIDFSTQQNFSAAPTKDWRFGANGVNGIKSFTLTVPAAFDPQSNLADATLIVGHSANNVAVSDCLKPDASGGPAMVPVQQTVNGIQFSVFHSSDAGAGNLYDITSYRTLHAGQCYAIEYTIHSSQIANYPASYGLHQYNSAKITSALQHIVNTFSFL